MSASQHTRNLSLPQFEASDKPSWLGDINSAMLSIDNGYGNQAADITKANDAASNASAQSTANQVAIGQLNTEMESVTNRLASLEAGSGTEDLESRISSIENEQGTLDGRIETVEDDVSQHGTDIASLQSGQTTLSNTLSAAETNISNNQKAITAVETSVNNVSASLRTTDTNVAKNSTNITSLTTKTNTTNANLNTLTTRVSHLENISSVSGDKASSCVLYATDSGDYVIRGAGGVVFSAPYTIGNLKYCTISGSVYCETAGATRIVIDIPSGYSIQQRTSTWRLVYGSMTGSTVSTLVNNPAITVGSNTLTIDFSSYIVVSFAIKVVLS